MHDINSESGTKADIEKRNESYNAYVKNVTPKGSCVAKCFKAFIVGGCICVAGQIILNVCKWMKVPDTDAASYTTLILVFLSVILTGLNYLSVYNHILAEPEALCRHDMDLQTALPLLRLSIRRRARCSVLDVRYSRLQALLFCMEYFSAGVPGLYTGL